MPEIKALKCQSCGAPLEVEEGQTVIKCPFCGTVNMIKPEPGETKIGIELSEIVETTLEEIGKAKPTTPLTAAPKAIGGLILAAMILIGGVVAAIIIPILSNTRGPNYSLLQAKTRDDEIIAVLYGDSRYHLGRVNPKTGKLIWRKEVGKDYSVRRIALGEDRVYTSAEDGFVRCYDLKKGDLLWEGNPGAVVYHDRNFIPLGDGLCFLGNDDTLRFFDRNGKQTIRVFCNSWRSMTTHGDRIYLAQDTLLKALSSDNGKAMFRTNLGFDIRNIRSDESGIYVLGNAFRDNKTYVARLDPKSGSVLWQNAYPSTYSYDSLLVIAGGLYLFDDSLVSLSPAGGQRLGKFYEDGWEPARLLPVDDVLFIVLRRTRGVTAYKLLAVDPGSLASKWATDLRDTMVLVGDGVFVVDTGQEKVSARKMDGKTGRELWMKKLDLRGYIYCMFLAGDNLILSGFGSTVAIRTRDGEQAWKGIRR